MLLAACCGCASAADAVKARAELGELKSRIETLRAELGRAEESRSDVADRLKESEQAISQAGRKLRELARMRAQAEAELAGLQRQSDSLGQRVEATQQALGRLLARHYRAGRSDPLRLILGGSDPNQVARDHHFLELLSRAQAELIGKLRAALRARHELADRLRARREDLAGIERQQSRERDALLAQKEKRKRVLAEVAGKIRLQRSEIATLKRNEQRLSRLIEGLGRIVARPAGRSRGEATGSGARPALRNEALPEAASAAPDFAILKGRLRLPARGELARRFGTPIGATGAPAKGVFIRAGSGEEVRAIAGGRVVFADWLRGFGNLIIVDHAGGYLSVYGNNESLLKGVGDPVSAGEAIAVTGASGGSEESGLYFELRHQGQPIDPMKWVNLR